MKGSLWRQDLTKTFADLDSVDWDCPRGKPWIAVEEPREVTYHVDELASYDTVRAEILASSGGGMWETLRETLRLTEEVIAMHKNHSSCWKNKQKVRIVKMWGVARQKEGSAGNVIAQTVKVQDG